MRPPKFYDRIFDRDNPEYFKSIKEKRKKLAEKNPEYTKKRLAIRERIARLKLKKSKRELE